ncbi:TolC family protein [Nitrosophilus alvini]|uniref:TolC family protein n=1 Tax=Nitrosophilus alvini TaxID=2714855 RepID=UPI00190AD063|nr:TolC family protein [Nitrosophilus alvini]
MAKYLSFLAILLLFAGCYAKKEPLPGEIAEIQKNMTNAETKKWWKVFEDENLNRLLEEALAENFSLKSIRKKILQAEAQLKKSRSPLFPAIDATIGVSRSFVNESGYSDSENSFSLGAAAKYEVDLWGKIDSLSKAAGFEYKASKEDFKAANVTFTSEIAKNWYGYLYQSSRLRLLAEKRDIARKELETLKKRFVSAQADVSDILQQKSTIKEIDKDIVFSKNEKKIFATALNVMLSKKPDEKLIFNESAFPDVLSVKTPKIEMSKLMQRPDIKSLYYKLQAQDERYAAAISAQYPRLALSSNISSSSSGLNNVFDNWFASIAASAVSPIFDAGERKADVKAARAKTEELLFRYKQALLDAAKEVTDLLEKIESQKQYIKILKKQKEIAQKNIEFYRSRYITGQQEYRRYLSALMSFKNLEEKELKASYELALYYIGLYRALSTGWEEDKDKK